MAFFMPYTARHSEAPLANFLRLVDDLNSFPGAGSNPCRGYARRVPRAAPRPWNPRFEARETKDAYVLRGELPGLNRDHVTIEFPEAQKIVISGKVVEEIPEAAPTAPAVEDATTAAVDDGDDDSAMAEETSSRSSYQATVEDGDDDDDDFELLHSESPKKQQEKQPEAGPAAEPTSPQPETEEPAQQQQPASTEPRVLRQFTRAFTFDAPLEYDFVTASLKDGLLEVIVPKLKHQPHQVIVN